jgi:hypothetical protein
MTAKGTANQLDEPVHIGGDAMNGADKGIFAAANHSHTELPVHV